MSKSIVQKISLNRQPNKGSSVRQLLGNAAFSPSLVSGIGFYVKRLKQEEFTRRLGLIFSALAVGLQSLALFSPPEPALASGPNNIIYSGVVSVEDLLTRYDANDAGNGHQDLQAIFAHYGISRTDLAGAQPTTIRSTDRGGDLRSVGRKAYSLPGETAAPIGGSDTTLYERPLTSWDSNGASTYVAYVGTTADGRWFAVLANCGNIVIDEPPPAPLNPIGYADATCEAISGWAYDPNQPSRAIRVVIYVGLNDTSSYDTFTLTANLPQPAAPVSGNHGFNLPIPSQWKSATTQTLYTVVALEEVGGGSNTELASEVVADAACESPEPEPCPYDSSLMRDDSDCRVCPYDASLGIQQDDCRPPSSTPTPPQPCPYQAGLSDQDELCAPCPYDANLWLKDERCREPFALIIFNKQARNDTQDVDDADGNTAESGDQITYTLAARNIGTLAGETEFAEDLTDVLEYAELVEADGAEVVTAQGSTILDWGVVSVPAGDSVTKTIVVKIKDDIPAVPANSGNQESYNLELRNIWHDQAVLIKVPRPLAKTPEVLAANLPNTGPSANVIISLIMIVTTAYFYARNRQLIQELNVVRRAYSAGGL